MTSSVDETNYDTVVVCSKWTWRLLGDRTAISPVDLVRMSANEDVGVGTAATHKVGRPVW